MALTAAITAAATSMTRVEYAAWYNDNVAVYSLRKEAFAGIDASSGGVTPADAARIDAIVRCKLRWSHMTDMLRAAPACRGHWTTEIMPLLAHLPLDVERVMSEAKTFVLTQAPLPENADSPGRPRTSEDGAIFLSVLQKVCPDTHGTIVDGLTVLAVDSLMFECMDEAERWCAMLVPELQCAQNGGTVRRDSTVSRNAMFRIEQLLIQCKWARRGQTTAMPPPPAGDGGSGVTAPICLLELVPGVKELPDMPDAVKESAMSEAALTVPYKSTTFTADAPGPIKTRPRACVALVELTASDGTGVRAWVRHAFVKDLHKLFRANGTVSIRSASAEAFIAAGIAVLSRQQRERGADDRVLVALCKAVFTTPPSKICIGRHGV